MAPPKPTTPDAATKPQKKKVTPAQVAFLVDRYLDDNGFHAALAAFRSDAARLFSPNRAKPPPKGLLPLADILHDYIALKEGRVAIDSAMHAMRSLVSTYYASSPTPPPMMPPLHPPANSAQPSSPPLVPPLLVASSSSSPPQPQGTAAGYASPVVHHYAHASTALLVHNSTGVSSCQQTTKKRKNSKSAGRTTTASKKSCIASATTSDTKVKAVASQLSNDNLSAAHPTSAEHSAVEKLPVQNSSVAKSLFRPVQPQLHSSPCTPQQSYAIQDQDQAAACPTQMPLPVAASAQPQQDIASSQCSIVSSKTLIVSPLKGGAYYAVERSYRVSSPLKSTTHKSIKREHVKGKLNFDITDSIPNEQQICDKASTSDEDKQDDFDIDFTNLDIFNGEFSFNELLLELDLDTEGGHCQNPSTSPEVQRLEPAAKSGSVTEDPALPDSVKSMAADFTEDFNSQGATSVTSVRAITKRIKIVSPVKGRTAS